MTVTPYRVSTTVPTPRLPRDARVPSSAGLVALGDAAADIGLDLRRAEVAADLTAARKKMMEAFGTLDTESLADPDPVTLGQRTEARLSALEKDIIPDSLPKPARDQLSLEFERERQTLRRQVAGRAFVARGQVARADLDGTLSGIENRILSADDPAVIERLEADAERAIGTAVAGGLLNAEAAQTKREAFRSNISRGAAEKAILADPARAATMLSQPGAFDLDERDRLRFLDHAQRKAEAAANAAEAVLGRRVGTAVTALLNGYPIDTTALEAEAKGTPFEKDLSNAIAARRFRNSDFFAQPAAARAAALQELQGAVESTTDLRIVGMLEQIDADLRRAEAASATDAEKALRGEVGFAIDVLMDGGTPAELAMLRTKVAGTPFAQPLAKAEVYAEELGDAYAADPQKRRTLIAGLRDGNLRDSLDVALLRNLEQIDAAARRDATADPVAFGQRTGIVRPGTLDLGDAEAVTRRLAEIDALARREGVQPAYFSKAEAESLGNTIRTANVEDRLALATAIATGFGDRAHAAFDQLKGADAVFAHAGHLVTMTQDREAAATILRGKAMIDAGGAPALSSDRRRTVVAGQIGQALDAAPPELRGTIEEAALAWFAARAPGRAEGQGGDAEERLFAEAIQAAAGQTKIGGRVLGGVQDLFGARVLLPPSLDARTVLEGVERAQPSDWLTASVFGGAPMDGPESALPRQPVFRARPGGTYIVGVEYAGQVRWLTDPRSPNGLYHVRLDQLVDRARPRRVQDPGAGSTASPMPIAP